MVSDKSFIKTTYLVKYLQSQKRNGEQQRGGVGWTKLIKKGWERRRGRRKVKRTGEEPNSPLPSVVCNLRGLTYFSVTCAPPSPLPATPTRRGTSFRRSESKNERKRKGTVSDGTATWCSFKPPWFYSNGFLSTTFPEFLSTRSFHRERGEPFEPRAEPQYPHRVIPSRVDRPAHKRGFPRTPPMEISVPLFDGSNNAQIKSYRGQRDRARPFDAGHYSGIIAVKFPQQPASQLNRWAALHNRNGQPWGVIVGDKYVLI